MAPTSARTGRAQGASQLDPFTSEITMPTKKNAKEAYAEAKWFAALGHTSRLAILRTLAEGEKSLQEITAILRVDYNVIRSSVIALEGVGLVYTQLEGNQRFCKLVGAEVNKDSIELTSPTGAKVVLPV